MTTGLRFRAHNANPLNPPKPKQMPEPLYTIEKLRHNRRGIIIIT